jgi:hypothetical protein
VASSPSGHDDRKFVFGFLNNFAYKALFRQKFSVLLSGKTSVFEQNLMPLTEDEVILYVIRVISRLDTIPRLIP